MNMSGKHQDLQKELARVERDVRILESILDVTNEEKNSVERVSLDFPDQSLQFDIDVEREANLSSVCVTCSDKGRELESVQWCLNHGKTNFNIPKYSPVAGHERKGNTNEFSNKEINSSCEKIKHYMDEHPDKTVTFDKSGQGYGKMVAFVPKGYSRRTLSEWKTGFTTQMEHMSRYKKTEDNEPLAAKDVFRMISKDCPVAFDEVARERGYRTKLDRMSAVQTAGLAKAAGITEKTLTNVVGRHLSVHFDSYVLSTQKDLRSLSKDAPDENVWTYKYQPDEKAKVEDVVVRQCNVL